MVQDTKSLEQLTKEDYQKALSEIQGALSACVGDLIILGGYLESDLSLDSENTHYVLMAAKDIVRGCLPVREERPQLHISDGVERGKRPQRR